MDEAAIEQARLEQLQQSKRSAMSACSSVDGGESCLFELARRSDSAHDPAYVKFGSSASG